MNNTAPIWMGIAAIAGMVFIVGTGVALVLYDFPLVSAVFVGAVVAFVAGLALFFGWAPRREEASIATPVVTPVTTPDPVAEVAPFSEPIPAPLVETTPAAVATPDPVAVPPVADAPAASGKPVFLTAARDSGADDLKKIRGVGPKLEQTLYNMGIFHFDQIAVWGPAEQAWMDDNLEGFKGRVSRDDWVGQAKMLMAGGTA